MSSLKSGTDHSVKKLLQNDALLQHTKAMNNNNNNAKTGGGG